MNATPTVKVTLQNNSGTVSAYKPGAKQALDETGLKEAIIVCFAQHAGSAGRIELLRSDLPGAAWKMLEAAGAYPELDGRLKAAASDLLDGHDPHIVFTVGAGGKMDGATLFTDSNALQAELKDSVKRSLAVPRLLPYQLGGTSDGAVALLYKPEQGKLQVHSMHPTQAEAQLAESHLQQRGEKTTGLLSVHTPVTSLLKLVADGAFKPAVKATVDAADRRPPTPSGHHGLMSSPLAAPSPFVN